MGAIKAGDFVGFGAYNPVDPWKHRVDGFCDECNRRRDERANWIRSLNPVDRNEFDKLEHSVVERYETLEYLKSEPDSSARAFPLAEARLNESIALYEEFALAHDAPQSIWDRNK